MRPRSRPARRPRPLLLRTAGYGGAALLVAAAVAVLLTPLLDGAGTAGAGGVVRPSATASGGAPEGRDPGAGGPGRPTNPVPQQDGGGRPYPGAPGGGPQIPAQNGPDAPGWCPRGTVHYRAARDGVDVAIAVAASGAIRVELSQQGRAPRSQQAAVRGGGPRTFHFGDVAPRLVRRVKVTTVSVGVAMQTCYARPAA